MASGNDDSGVTTALATIGTVLWCIQLIPQVVRNWYVRDCEGVPPLMMFLFAACGVPFGAYFVIQSGNTALIVQPHLFMFFSSLGFWQSLYYRPVKWPMWRCNVILLVAWACFAGIEAALIVPLRHLYNEGTHWPNLIVGVFAAVLLAVGLLPPYWELYKRNGQCVGINFVFLFLDSTGAIFSTAAVATQKGHVDILGLILYLVVLGLEYGIMLSHFIWMIRVKYFGLPIEPSKSMANAGSEMDPEWLSVKSNACTKIGENAATETACDPERVATGKDDPPSRTQPLRDFVTVHIVDRCNWLFRASIEHAHDLICR